MTAANDIKNGLWAVIAIAALAVALVLPTQAVADECSEAASDPTAAQYCPPTEVTPPPEEAPVSEESSSVESVQAESTPEEAAPVSETESSASGSLPFTGLDLAALAAVAAALTATGFALRRLSGSGSR